MNRARTLLPIWVFIASLASVGAIVLFSSCAKSTRTSGKEVLYSAPSDLKPFANPGPKANMILLSTELPVDVDYQFDGKDLIIRLEAMGQEFEVEKYRLEESRFLLVQAASERFEPPLPLLDFPVTDSQKLEWKGELHMGGINKEATATTIVTKGDLNEKGLSGPAIRASVELTFDGGLPTPSKRILTFWFVPGKGIQKRVIDKGSTRLPWDQVSEAAATSEKT